jgi:hypothetical protein
VEEDGDVVTDLHLWSIGPGIRAASITIASARPRPPDEYKGRLPEGLGVVHAVVEVHPTTRE